MNLRFIFIFSSKAVKSCFLISYNQTPLWVCNIHVVYCFCFVDDEEPTFDCQNITTSTDAGQDSLSNVTIAPYVYDNVDVEPNVTCSHTSNDTFLIGNTTVTCTSTDNAGNTGTCSFIITVIGKDITRLCL